MTLAELECQFATETACAQYLFRLRWAPIKELLAMSMSTITLMNKRLGLTVGLLATAASSSTDLSSRQWR